MTQRMREVENLMFEFFERHTPLLIHKNIARQGGKENGSTVLFVFNSEPLEINLSDLADFIDQNLK